MSGSTESVLAMTAVRVARATSSIHRLKAAWANVG